MYQILFFVFAAGAVGFAVNLLVQRHPIYSALSLIGEGLNNDSTILTATLELLEQRGVQVTGVTTTSFRISLLVPLNRIDMQA